ncbi:unnamed protein product [Blepharisma stoltei]|uniref:Uncharacterized protein n=1 Tax=Blepharisma stoltei TaxID=1481888 RepID=A0AAU9JUG3_9CILI|nr:unnamed protein product [Blepharisma stoltei]
MKLKVGKKKRNLVQNENLPPEFSTELVVLEQAIENNCSMEIINSTIMLYSKAIEHYEALKDPQYLEYQNKLKVLLHRKDVKSVINYQDSVKSSEPKKPALSSLNKHRNIENVLREFNNENNSTRPMIHENLKQQQDVLEYKMRARKNSLKNNLSFGSELSEEDLEKFEEKLEDLIEKFVTEKIQKSKEIADLYSTQISEMKNMGDNEVINQIIFEMEKNKEREISIISKNVENAMGKEIEILRKEYNVI